MAHAVSVDAKTLDRILRRLDDLTRDMAEIKEKLLDKEPPYGSEKWWKLSDKQAKDDVKAGRYTVIHNKKELQEHLDSLKKS